MFTLKLSPLKEEFLFSMSKSKKLDFRSKTENGASNSQTPFNGRTAILESHKKSHDPHERCVCPAQPVQPVLKMPSDLAGSQLSSCSHTLYKVRLRKFD